MKINDVLQAGYNPVKYKGSYVADCFTENKTGILMMLVRELGKGTLKEEYVSLEKDHTDLDIEFQMVTLFNEETANGFLISEVSPLFKNNIATKKIGNLRHYLEEKEIKKALFKEGPSM